MFDGQISWPTSPRQQHHPRHPAVAMRSRGRCRKTPSRPRAGDAARMPSPRWPPERLEPRSKEEKAAVSLTFILSARVVMLWSRPRRRPGRCWLFLFFFFSRMPTTSAQDRSRRGDHRADWRANRGWLAEKQVGDICAAVHTKRSCCSRQGRRHAPVALRSRRS